ncbi:MAG: GNAT family N-acetyltransferase [Bacilli bacterium]
MEILIRQATVNDFDSINEIANQEHEMHIQLRPDLYNYSDIILTNKWFSELLDNGSIIVGEFNKKVVSYGIFYIKKTNEPLLINKKVMYLKAIANEKNYIGLGIGKQMMNYIIKLAKENKCDLIELQVDSENKRAVIFYEHLGMTEKSRVMELKLID